jgi:hypothetical protein
MHFDKKSYLKNNRYHITKHILRIAEKKKVKTETMAIASLFNSRARTS